MINLHEHLDDKCKYPIIYNKQNKLIKTRIEAD